MFDLVFRGARIVDGTGRPAYSADVAVTGDRIAHVGQIGAAEGRRTVDADGAVIAPGFIDLHTHSDFTLPCSPRAQSMVRQGVTTQLTGNCGLTPYPIVPERLDLIQRYTKGFDPGLTWDWTSLAEYAAALEAQPLASNVALQIGHGSVRIAAMGFENRPPTEAEVGLMKILVAQACQEGALGFSSGLIYTPGSYCNTDELIALARVAARHGAFYSSHIRGEGETLLEAVDEALAVGREADIPVQLSHHKAAGKKNWGKVNASLDRIDHARAAGQDVLADQYPYTAGSTGITALLPAWAMEGGVGAMLQRLANPATRLRIEHEMSDRTQFELDDVMISNVPSGSANAAYEGMMLTEIARRRTASPAETALWLTEQERGAVLIIVFSMAEEDVRRVMQHPAVTIGSDGWVMGPESGGRPHPRNYGTYARVLGYYVRQEGLLSLEEAVRKMTSLPASRLGQDDLGIVWPGARADLVVFDPTTVADRATYENPHQFCTGVEYVVVNGQIVVEQNADTGARAGRVIRRR